MFTRFSHDVCEMGCFCIYQKLVGQICKALTEKITITPPISDKLGELLAVLHIAVYFARQHHKIPDSANTGAEAVRENRRQFALLCSSQDEPVEDECCHETRGTRKVDREILRDDASGQFSCWNPRPHGIGTRKIPDDVAAGDHFSSLKMASFIRGFVGENRMTCRWRWNDLLVKTLVGENTWRGLARWAGGNQRVPFSDLKRHTSDPQGVRIIPR